MMEQSKIITIAERVRKAVASIATHPKLAGYCGIASLALQTELEKNGVECTVWEGEYRGFGHAWVVCNNQIIDITASQFSYMPDIYTCPAYRKGCGYRPMYKMESLKDFNEWEKEFRPSQKNQQKINDAIRRYTALL